MVQIDSAKKILRRLTAKARHRDKQTEKRSQSRAFTTIKIKRCLIITLANVDRFSKIIHLLINKQFSVYTPPHLQYDATNEATQTHCYNPVAPAYPVWAHHAHGRQRRCQEDPVSLPSGRLEKTTRSSLHHVAQHLPTGSETTPSFTPRSRRFGSEPPSVEDDVDVWHYTIASCMPETTATRSCEVENPKMTASSTNCWGHFIYHLTVVRQTVSRLLTLTDWLTFWSLSDDVSNRQLNVVLHLNVVASRWLFHCDYLCTVFVRSTLYFVRCTHNLSKITAIFCIFCGRLHKISH